MAKTGSYEPISPIPQKGREPFYVYFIADDSVTYKEGAPAKVNSDGTLDLATDDDAATLYVVAETVVATADVTEVKCFPLIPGHLWRGVIEGVSAATMVGDAVGFDIAGTTLTAGAVVLNGTNNFFVIEGIDPRFSWGDTHAVVILRVRDDLA